MSNKSNYFRINLLQIYTEIMIICITIHIFGKSIFQKSCPEFEVKRRKNSEVENLTLTYNCLTIEFLRHAIRKEKKKHSTHSHCKLFTFPMTSKLMPFLSLYVFYFSHIKIGFSYKNNRQYKEDNSKMVVNIWRTKKKWLF